MTKKDIEILSTCDGMLDILEDAVRNLQAMPISLFDDICKASIMRQKDRENNTL